MDPQIAALAGAAGTTIVTLMATDAWQRTRDGVTSIWKRVHPERVDALAAELDLTREQVLAARDVGDTPTEDELRAEWQGRVRRLLLADPSVVEDLRELLDELAPEASVNGDTYNVQMHARATEQGRVYQAGRDQHISES
ncbi:hypothetical protein [Streptomyces albidus (ex Kaewkla and Franco 2022)]|uniref:hypothetical protein n=1 Tax=Streptomyces albidus (ex Kaewkla and Franco 2022) TaxID=722709 RepID=UPI0015EE8D68|nr:hypothetical protein [Streptomyces albidus (ex Kaewkla and Franco 2022)]